jgi:hypothetical protein
MLPTDKLVSWAVFLFPSVSGWIVSLKVRLQDVYGQGLVLSSSGKYLLLSVLLSLRPLTLHNIFSQSIHTNTNAPLISTDHTLPLPHPHPQAKKKLHQVKEHKHIPTKSNPTQHKSTKHPPPHPPLQQHTFFPRPCAPSQSLSLSNQPKSLKKKKPKENHTEKKTNSQGT